MQPNLAFMISVFAVALSLFLSVASWADARKKERVVLYRTELLKKLSEQPTESARQILTVLREQAEQREIQRRRALRLGGWIVAVVGLGVGVMLAVLEPNDRIWIAGLIPLLIGVVLIVFGSKAPSPAAPAALGE